MLYLIDCGVGNIVELYGNGGDNLADYTMSTNYVVKATYLGYYPASMDSSDQCLIGWKYSPNIRPILSCAPKSFNLGPLVRNPQDYKYFRWCGKGRYAKDDLGPDAITPMVVLKTGQLSPIHAPGWHQCKCGFRNKDISITAVVAGKYVCYQCRNIWKK